MTLSTRYCQFPIWHPRFLLNKHATNECTCYIFVQGCYIIVITHPWDFHMICKCDAPEYSGLRVYKSDTNQTDVLQLLCFMVCKQVKGTLSLCQAWRMILYCWSCATKWCRQFSWWKALGFHTISQNRFIMPTCVTSLHSDSLQMYLSC